ncbi:MAG: acyl-CoA dehydrogenase [Pseudomonadota bacterium]
MSTIVDRRDLDFHLYEVLKAQQLFQQAPFAAFDRDTVEGMFDGAQALAEEVFLPIAGTLDRQEPEFQDGRAVMIPEAGAALDAFAEAGFFKAGFPEDLGGLQVPYVFQLAMNGMFAAANNSLFGFPMLTVGAANMLNAFGSEAQKARFLPPMLDGRWFGTMCLSETQAGSSLADIRTLATPRDDGSFSITGTKMWISGGEQDISENIVHMVLAKTPDAPPGVRGISMFIVPKYRVHEDGTAGEPNHIALAGLNHKMGQRGLPNTVLNFGEGGETIGHLVGDLHHGLAYMFHMMNEARILVGQGAVMLGLTGYLHSLAYAKERPQGRAPGNRDPESPQIPIIEHADVRRMLLSQKANVEGALSLILFCGQLVDEIRLEKDSPGGQQKALLLDVLTPIAKSWPSEFCLEANKLAIQVLGGYGYTRDYPLERFYRDNRLNAIHEGAYGIQAIDLLNRKVSMHGGAGFAALLAAVGETRDQARAKLPGEAEQLATALALLEQTTATVLACEDVEQRLANATLYLDAAGHIVIAWMWLRQGLAARARHEADGPDQHFYAGKLAAMEFFFRYELPKAETQLRMVAALDRSFLHIDPAAFAVTG